MPDSGRRALLSLAVALLAASSAPAATFARHVGQQDPVTEGWTASGASPPSGVTTGPVAPDADDIAGWFVNDHSTAGGSTWSYAVQPASAAGLTAGWTLRSKLRAFNLDDANDASVFLELADGSRRWVVTFGSQSDGAMTVAVWGGSTVVIPPAVAGVTGYHLVELAANPLTGVADLYVDGQLRLSNLVGISGSLDRLVFGSGQSSSTGHGRYAMVELLTGPQECRDGIDNDGDGLVDFAGGDPGCASPQDPHEGSALDSDFDGVSDADEAAAGTDPLLPDTDGDGLGDRFELANGFDPLTPGEQAADPDGDGLDNAAEQAAGSNPNVADTDGDGIPDGDEVSLYGSSPTSADSDGDGIPDLEEVSVRGTDPTRADTDGDGLSDAEEPGPPGTDPLVADTDGDGLNDGNEVHLAGTNPLDPDSDDDGLNDGAEVLSLATNPLLWDSDGDGLGDGFEVAAGFDPLTPGEETLDPDGDGLTNLDEQAHGSDPRLADTDGDGLPDGAEVSTWGTLPSAADTDGDGLSDGYEAAHGLDPLLAGDAAADPDVDGLTNLREMQLGTDPQLVDSDGDGVTDGDEVRILGTDPLDPASSGVEVATSSALDFEAQDQPLFSDLASNPTVIPIVNDSHSGTVGRIVSVDEPVPLWKVQAAWDQALDTCNNTRTISTTNFCADLHVTPTDQQCIDGGNINISGYSVTCCNDFGSYSNGCGILGSSTYTIADLNALPGGPYVSTTYNVGPGIGPRPTQPPSQPFDVGAQVSENVSVNGQFSVNLDLQDPGRVDLAYRTVAKLRSNRSTVPAGDTFTLEAVHAPTDASSMTSLWPAASFTIGYDFDIAARVDATYATVDPTTGAQGYWNGTPLDEHLVESGELVGLRAGIVSGLELRFMNGVSWAPELYRDVSWTLIPPLPGVNIELGFTVPETCPNAVFTLSAACQLMPHAPVTLDMAGLRFQIPDLNSPAGENFNGGAVALNTSTRVEPLRNSIASDGSLVNTLPSRYRPLTNFTNDTNLFEKLFVDQTSLSPDIARVEADVDGMLSLASGGAFLAGANFEDPEGLIGLSFDVLDSDVVAWASYDQTLTFSPNLVADVRFDKTVEVFDDAQGAFVTLPAGQPFTIAARASGGEVPQALAGVQTRLQVRQPPGGVRVSVDYSFRNNLFSNATYPLTTFAWQNTFLQVSFNGIVPELLREAGYPLSAAPFRATYSPTEPIQDTRRGGIDPFVGVSGDTFAGGSFTVLDLAADSDRDGLPDALEAVGCTSPFDADSDDDGLPDGIEDANRNGLVDAGETNPCDSDSDGDGLQDGTERGLLTPTPDPDGAGPLLGTDLAVFVPARDPSATSDPTDPTDPASASAVPALGPPGQVLLAFGLGLAGAWVQRRRRAGAGC